MENKVVSCAFNMDTASVEVRYADGSMLSIYCPKIEDEFSENMYERSELTWLAYSAPADYVNLLLHGDMRKYLNNAADYHPLDT